MRHFIIVTTTLIVTLSLFAQFALTASAPAHSDAVSPHARQLLLEAKGRTRGRHGRNRLLSARRNQGRAACGRRRHRSTSIEANEVAVSESDPSTMLAFRRPQLRLYQLRSLRLPDVPAANKFLRPDIRRRSTDLFKVFLVQPR